jgi:formylglycine-generating enzyme required for sulfatase activity
MSETQNTQEPQDYLGYSVYAQTLWARVARALEKDAFGQKELGDDPLVVGIFGEWGAGKSKLLSLIQKHAVEDAENKAGWRKLDSGNFTLTVPVFFQPWKYEHEAHLHVPILLHILAALEREMKNAQTSTEAFFQHLPDGVKDHLGKVVGAFGVLLSGVAMAMDTQVPLLSRLGLAVAGAGATAIQKDKAETGEKLADQLEFKNNGRFFYEMHQTLQAITRPSRYAKQLTGVDLSTPVSINFVLFIDDLDRCLPEKAVETLELIKTIFNLESFAFVLALDEEVVERGIGHRYQSYVLKDKKPEMPITGFEYLEKIVHLPFRLPALTRAQAMAFVRRYEAQLEKDENLHWFAAPKGGTGFRGGKERGDMMGLLRGEKGSQLDLLPLALGSFAHYVPRKLIRMVELMHGIAQISRLPGYRDIGREYGGAIDPRVVLALVLLQLFQPELFRAMRRQNEAFSVLLAAFVPSDQGKTALSRTHVSDADLCQWVLGEGFGVGDLPNDGSKLIDHLSSRISKMLDYTDQQQRYLAQAVRLPLVSQLLAHRSIQRHVFDPIKLFQLLAADMHRSGHEPASVVLRPYLSLLTQKMQRNALDPKANQHSIHWVAPLVGDLLSSAPGVQANILSRHDIPEDAYLSESTTEEIAKAFATLLQDKTNAETQRAQLLQGLYYLAPVIAPDHASKLWDLVKDMVKLPQTFGQALENPKQAALWADVRDRLGLDATFDASQPYICADRYEKNSKEQEPLPGYVRIKAGDFKIGSHEDKDDNPPTMASIASDFFMARHLTTVRQYAQFVSQKGYEDEMWWDSQGWAWRKGQWASESNDEALRQWLDGRTLEQRAQPMWWDEQAEHPQRPVCGINWFEARAYCRWLTNELENIKNTKKIADSATYQGKPFTEWMSLASKGYAARLPTEAQWERSARAKDAQASDERVYSWGKSADNDEQKANIDDSGIGHASVVGLFAPSELGLMDMYGNLWEWQDNLYADKGKHKAWQRIDRITGVIETTANGKAECKDWLQTADEWEKSALPALRGGSWFSHAVSARASFRYRFLPDYYDLILGFRVVLSLASSGSEN